MNCNEVKEKLSAYIYRELSESEMAEIKGHLLSCKECTKEYEELKEIAEILSKDFYNINLSPDFDSKLRIALENENKEAEKKAGSKTKIRAIGPWRRYASIAAVFMVMILSTSLVLLIDRQNNDQLYSSKTTKDSDAEAKIKIAQEYASEEENQEKKEEQTESDTVSVPKENLADANIEAATEEQIKLAEVPPEESIAEDSENIIYSMTAGRGISDMIQIEEFLRIIKEADSITLASWIKNPKSEPISDEDRKIYAESLIEKYKTEFELDTLQYESIGIDAEGWNGFVISGTKSGSQVTHEVRFLNSDEGITLDDSWIE